jgi:hypothetical protein
MTDIDARMLSDILTCLECLFLIIALCLIAVAGICAITATRPGTHTLVSAVMAHTKKDPLEAPTDPALKLQSGD